VQMHVCECVTNHQSRRTQHTCVTVNSSKLAAVIRAASHRPDGFSNLSTRPILQLRGCACSASGLGALACRPDARGRCRDSVGLSAARHRAYSTTAASNGTQRGDQSCEQRHRNAKKSTNHPCDNTSQRITQSNGIHHALSCVRFSNLGVWWLPRELLSTCPQAISEIGRSHSNTSPYGPARTRWPASARTRGSKNHCHRVGAASCAAHSSFALFLPLTLPLHLERRHACHAGEFRAKTLEFISMTEQKETSPHLRLTRPFFGTCFDARDSPHFLAQVSCCVLLSTCVASCW
jgi:hypothetical protein